MSLTRLARRRGFQCLRHFEVKDWPQDRSPSEFGGCFTPQGHGHNYELEAYFEGTVDKVTGMIVNLADVDAMLEKVLKPIEGKNLDLDIAEFAGKLHTTETLAEYLSDKLFREMKSSHRELRLLKVRLYESENLWVDVWP